MDRARAPVARRFTEDPEAYGLFLKGRHHWNKRPAGTHAAIECLKRRWKKIPAMRWPTPAYRTATTLRSAGLGVDTYASGEEFLQGLPSRLPDCLLLDLQLAGMNRLAVRPLRFPVCDERAPSKI